MIRLQNSLTQPPIVILVRTRKVRHAACRRSIAIKIKYINSVLKSCFYHFDFLRNVLWLITFSKYTKHKKFKLYPNI